MAGLRLRNVLLDRDGTIIEERHYLHDPDGVSLLPGSGDALARLTKAGLRLFCVTNQSGIGRGYYDSQDFEAVQRRMLSLLSPYGAVITDTVHCPHPPDAGCACRKPATGLFTDLAAHHGINPEDTAMIGDTASDIAFGLAFGSPLTILVLTGHGRRDAARLRLPPLKTPYAIVEGRRQGWPHMLAQDLAAAIDYLLDATPG